MKKLLPYIISVAIGAVAVVIIICAYKIWEATPEMVIVLLCDAFFATGAVLGGVGLIIFASNGGVFDMLKYSMLKLVDGFRRKENRSKYHSYYDYVEERKDKKRPIAYMLFVGLGFVTVACVFLTVYYTVYHVG